jgi:hypothetical protein
MPFPFRSIAFWHSDVFPVRKEELVALERALKLQAYPFNVRNKYE